MSTNPSYTRKRWLTAVVFITTACVGFIVGQRFPAATFLVDPMLRAAEQKACKRAWQGFPASQVWAHDPVCAELLKLSRE